MKLISKCPMCKGSVRISAVKCNDCGTEIRGFFSVSALSALPIEDQRLIEAFILCGGKLKDLAEQLGVSYPTIRARFDSVIERLKALSENLKADERNAILDKVEKGKISVDVASRWIKEL